MRRARKDAQQVLEDKVKDLLFPHLSTLETSAMDLSKSIDYSAVKGKTALITGAAGGLGRGMALEWAKNGCVALSFRDSSCSNATPLQCNRRCSGSERKGRQGDRRGTQEDLRKQQVREAC